MGPIPWSSVVEYGLRDGLDRDNVELLVDVLMQVDEAFLAWNREDLDRQGKYRNTKGPPPKADP